MRMVINKALFFAGGVALIIFIFASVPLLLIHCWHYPVTANLPENLAEPAQSIWNYLLYENSNVLPDFPDGIRERRHMLDVKRLINSLEMVSLYTGLSGIFLLLTCHNPWKLIRFASRLGIFGIAFSGLAILLVGFDNVFIFIHKLLFRQNTWWFGEESLLIRLFPTQYFMELAFISSLLILLIFISTLIYSQKRNK